MLAQLDKKYPYYDLYREDVLSHMITNHEANLLLEALYEEKTIAYLRENSDIAVRLLHRAHYHHNVVAIVLIRSQMRWSIDRVSAIYLGADNWRSYPNGGITQELNGEAIALIRMRRYDDFLGIIAPSPSEQRLYGFFFNTPERLALIGENIEKLPYDVRYAYSWVIQDVAPLFLSEKNRCWSPLHDHCTDEKVRKFFDITDTPKSFELWDETVVTCPIQEILRMIYISHGVPYPLRQKITERFTGVQINDFEVGKLLASPASFLVKVLDLSENDMTQIISTVLRAYGGRSVRVSFDTYQFLYDNGYLTDDYIKENARYDPSMLHFAHEKGIYTYQQFLADPSSEFISPNVYIFAEHAVSLQ